MSECEMEKNRDAEVLLLKEQGQKEDRASA